MRVVAKHPIGDKRVRVVVEADKYADLEFFHKVKELIYDNEGEKVEFEFPCPDRVYWVDEEGNPVPVGTKGAKICGEYIIYKR